MGIIAGEGHLGLEITTVVEGIRVEHDKSHTPFKDVIVQELQWGQSLFAALMAATLMAKMEIVACVPRCWSMSLC
jgi:hypothetical protein